MKVLWLSACGGLTAAPALADALEGKKSGAEILAATIAEDWREIPADDMLIIELARGKIYVALSPALAPEHVKQVKTLAREGFYDGLSFYRVIDGFVAQGGDPFSEKKTNTSGKTLKAEFEAPLAEGYAIDLVGDADGYAPNSGFVASLPAGSDFGAGTAWHLHCAGAFAFGREDGRDTASTEFYVTLQPQRYLDRNMSVFGRVVAGMEHLQALRRVAPPQDKADDPGETIVSMRVAADVPPAERQTFEILDSARRAFADYAEARRNRPEAFFHFRPNHLDVCQLPVPVREKPAP